MVLTSENEMRKEVLSKDDPTTAYIILQNGKYQQMIEEVTNENISLKQTLEEQENELDSMSKSKICLQGYVKNEYEYAQNWKFISTFYKEIMNKSYPMITAFILANMISIIIGMIGVSNINHLKMFISISNAVLVVVYTKYMYMIYHAIYKNKEILKIMEEMKRIERSNQYIQDLIDNI